jgi:uncharacterized protein YuzE
MAKTDKAESEKNVVFLYNKTDDVLSVEKKRKGAIVKGSIDIGEVILDVSDKGFIIGIEFLNASKNIGIPKDILSKIEDVHFNVRQGTDYIVVRLAFFLDKKEYTHTTHVPISSEALLA